MKMDFPFFKISTGSGGLVTSGVPQCTLGHRVQQNPSDVVQGVFAEWNWDGTTLTAKVDRLGFCGLFVAEGPDGVSISPSPLQLIAEGAPATLDDGALGVFFRIGLFVNDDTPFKHIRVLPPGGTLTWTGGRVTITGGLPEVREVPISRPDAIEKFAKLLRQGVERCISSTDKDLLMPLSGGRDSRHILFNLERLGRLPKKAITFQPWSDELGPEATAAREVAERVGVPHEVLNARRSRPRDLVRSFVLSHFCSDETLMMMALRDGFCGPDIATLDGIGGDVLSRNKQFSNPEARALYESGNHTQIAENLIDGHAKAIGASVEDLFGADEVHRRFPRADAIDRLSSTLQTFASFPDPYTAFVFFNRTRREISLIPHGVMSATGRVMCPYLDSEVVDFLLSLPFEVTSGGSFHSDTIAQTYPQYADIPYDSDLPEAESVRSRLSQVRTVLDGLLVGTMVRPSDFAHNLLNVFQSIPGVMREHQDLYQSYRRYTENLDADRARRLIDVATRLDASATGS